MNFQKKRGKSVGPEKTFENIMAENSLKFGKRETGKLNESETGQTQKKFTSRHIVKAN